MLQFLSWLDFWRKKEVMEVLMKDLYCYECSLQFDTKFVSNIHLSVVHGEKLDIKQESDYQSPVIPEVKEIEILKCSDEENSWKNKSKRRKVSIKTGSDHKGKDQFKCDIFGQKGSLNIHVGTVHEGKKQFKCDICNASFGKKGNLNTHVATVHEGKKQFKCDICGANFGEKGTLKKHVATVHEGKKQFKCDICHASFGRKGNLHTHVVTVHEGNRAFNCDICNTNFGNK